jgi:hypothetical protein
MDLQLGHRENNLSCKSMVYLQVACGFHSCELMVDFQLGHLQKQHTKKTRLEDNCLLASGIEIKGTSCKSRVDLKVACGPHSL